ncbi:MAG: ATP-binding protein [Planctomycetota bacterium]
MSLRSKIVLILVSVVALYATVEFAITRGQAQRLFGRLEEEQAFRDLAQVRQRLDEELVDLGAMAGLVASAGQLELERHDRAGLEALGTAALEHARADLFYLCDSAGRVLFGRVLDPRTRQAVRLREFPGEALAPGHDALRFPGEADEFGGVLMTSSEALLFSSHALADGEGRRFLGTGVERRPANGVLILGRFLGSDLRASIAARALARGVAAPADSRHHIELLGADAPGLPPEMARSDGGRVLVVGADGLLHAYERMGALRTDQPLVLHAALERDIAAYESRSVNYLLLSILIGAGLILFVLLRLLQSFVIAPLSTLTAKAVEIGKSDDTTIRVGLARADEIGQLAGEFDRMLGKLAQSREQVVETARQAGMSEIATGVLHNVGNVLNSVNVAANLAARRTEELSVQDLELLAGVLQSHERDLAAFVAEDPRGKHLVPFLSELTGALGRQKQSIQSELRALNQGIEHIAELVRAQQSYAGTRGVFEFARLDDQVEAALAITAQALDSNKAVEVVREFEELPAVRVDKHKLMEILVNVIQNAGQALAERGGPGQRVVVRVRRANERTARIEVADNGVGIPAKNLTKIFHHGFTTKRNGHGFGLHVSANAATEMGAKLSVRSDGPGRGATFVLDIPLQAEAAIAAA